MLHQEQKMKNQTTSAIIGAVVAMSLVANAVMAQQAGAGKPRQEFKGPVKVFILAGQSNMEGHGGVKTLDRLGEHPTHGYLLKKIKNDDGSFVVRDDVFVSYQKADENTSSAPCPWAWERGGRIGSGRS